ncbi:general transcription factor 3C polypeptide 1 [Astyanax mexicanus]|uniref:General transcription factor 3C polypeptide 1 n=1 Tax=Astyanax mexicanus TaxID=7994 RepID=A0A8T2L1K1_ASTMX|nr:general transcription factor 3C polypeptide 1 [Astyanax mexicanus]
MDPLRALLDEVCLEGLDGITLSALWIRLRTRRPAFPLHLEPRAQQYLWSALTYNPHITFHLLPRARPTLQLRDRFTDEDPETGDQELSQPHQDPGWEDPYPVSVVLDDPQGIQGSCLYYREWEDITSRIRTSQNTPILTLEQANNMFGERLVMVGSQVMRYRALIGDEGDPELKLGDHSYCILERLGRARWQGEIQRDLHITSFKIEAGKLHYLRKSLDRNGLITMQSYVVRLPSGARQHSILLLLKRFHVDRRSKYDLLMESTSRLLSELPNQVGIVLKLREQLHVGEHTFKRVYQYMQTAKMVSVVSVPLQELNPQAGPFKTKKGTDIRVRCLKLLKPYTRKMIEEDDEDENNDEEGDGPVKRNVQIQARDVERDFLSQAYEMVVAAGSRGISQTALRGMLNVGKLESRMICRILERNNMIKGFMEDEGRQRTTKYISKLFVEKSKLNLQFNKERQRSQQLRVPPPNSPAPHDQQDTPLSQPETGDTLTEEEEPKEEPEPEKEPEAEPEPEEEAEPRGRGRRSKGKAGRKSKPGARKAVTSTPKHSTPLRKKKPLPKKDMEQSLEEAEVDQKDESLLNLEATPAGDSSSIFYNQSQNPDDTVTIEEVVDSAERRTGHEQHETYRLLKRKNLIIEAVRNLKVIEGLYTLQKKLMDEEKLDGVNTRVCKKSILRLIRTLAREGYLKLYRTTVIQDGVSKKMEFVVHPSITPDDPLVKSAIEQVRFKISSSYTVHRLKKQEKAKSLSLDVKPEPETECKASQGKTEEKMGVKDLKNFKPTIVPGLSRSLGFQPKMPRFRMVHSFLFYLLYDHPIRQRRIDDSSHTSDPDLTPHTVTVTPDPELTSTAPSTSAEGEGQSEGLQIPAEDEFTVYVNELSWKRFIPPLPVHRDFGDGWALTSDVLISLPLSVYVQVIQINYKVDGLEEFLNDPVKQHYLIKFLPSDIKTQLLHRRKYFYSFYENMQRLCFMGLLQFGPVEKFMDKDQGFFYLKKHATIVDTTVCEPHYNLAIETRPFDRRRYTFNSLQDVENYWFDLLCVCLNTPLGVIRPRSRGEDREADEQDVTAGPIRYESLQYTLRGSCEVMDDGVTPGDGQGAGGLDSTFFSHLKRNWLWTTHLLNKPKRAESQTVRLRNFLSKHTYPKSVCAAIQGGVGTGLAPPVVQEEEVQVGVESSSRNQQVRGGRKLKRKRQKKESSKPPSKKKRKVASVRKRTPCQDETDRNALMRMTRQRVTWSHLEDSILMLCRVASHFLNRKIKKPFVAWNVVRDILHAELELSLDKTSLSVGRRSRYIMKNPQTQLNYRICLAEVYQDKALVEEFMNKTNNYEDPKVCAEEFNAFVSALRSKFSSSYGASEVIIPDTKEELFNKFKVYIIGEEPAHRTKDVLNSVEDIHSLVLNNLIQSTLVLSSSQMKSCQAFQSFSLYSRYKAEVLQQVFIDCKKRGLVNRRRANKILGPKKNRAVPFMPMSYQLSQHYYRYFTWRFPSTLCNELYDLLEALREKGGVDRPNTFSFQRDKEAETDEGRLQSKGDGLQQDNAPLEPLAPLGDRKDSVLAPVAPPDDEKDSGTVGVVPPGGVEHSAVDPEAPPGNVEDSVGDALLPPIEDPLNDVAMDPLTPPTDMDDMLTFHIDAPGGASLCCLSLMTLGLLTVDVSIPQQVVVVDSTLVDNDVVKSITKELDEDDEDEGDYERRGRVEVKARQASHTNYLLIRGYFVPGIISLRNINSTDHIAINSCTVRIKLRHTPAHTLFKETDGALSLVTQSSTLSLPPSFSRLLKQRKGECGRSFVDRCVSALGYSSADVEAVQTLRAAVQEWAEFGTERLELCRRFTYLEQQEHGRTRTLQQYIQDMIDGEELLEVGGLSSRLVCVKSSAPWLLKCPTEVNKDMSQNLALSKSRKRSMPFRSSHSRLSGLPPTKRVARETVALENIAMAMSSSVSNVSGTSESGTSTPGSSVSGFSASGFSAPGTSVPGTFAPETSAPGTSASGTSVPGTSIPGTYAPGTSAPGISVPGTSAPETSVPGTVAANTNAPNVALKEATLAEAGDMESTAPGTITLETTTPAKCDATETLSPETVAKSIAPRVVVTESTVADSAANKENVLGACTTETAPAQPAKADAGRDATHSLATGNGRDGEGSKQEEDLSFVARPWRIVDGSLNRPVCKGMLEALLLHIMTNPAIPEPALLNHYSGVLQPVVILDLLQVLMELGCVKRRCAEIQPKVSLFSRPRAPVVRSPGEVSVTEDVVVFYEPTVDCSLRLSQLFPHESNWNKWVQLCVR